MVYNLPVGVGEDQGSEVRRTSYLCSHDGSLGEALRHAIAEGLGDWGIRINAGNAALDPGDQAVRVARMKHRELADLLLFQRRESRDVPAQLRRLQLLGRHPPSLPTALLGREFARWLSRGSA